MTTPTGIFVSYVRVHEEPVIQGDELEESEASSGQVAEPVWIHLPIQPSTDDSKYI